MTKKVVAIIIEDENGDQRIDMTSDDDLMQLPAEVQMRGILTAMRHILEVPEGESILDQCAKVVRRYKMSWPDWHRLNGLEHMENAQICRTYRDGGYVYWWQGHDNFPPIREAIDNALRRYRREVEDARPSGLGALPDAGFPTRTESDLLSGPGGPSSEVNAIRGSGFRLAERIEEGGHQADESPKSP